MDDIPEAEGQGPADLRFLKRLVTVLTATMIGGLLAIVALIVIRFGAAPGPALPETLVLPEGVRAEAVTAGRGWYAVVTEDQRLLIFGADGALRRTVEIAP